MAEGSKTRARALTPPEEAAPLFAEEDRRYDFVALAGEGGVGKVVACRDRVLGRQVALKVSRNDTDDADAMVTREARILARLDHPNIVPIYDLANTGHSSYYSMRLLEQPTLLDIIIELERGSAKVTHGRALRMFIQVCDAVAYAHSRGVVHCDLKPDNVLIGSYGEVTVVDWGFALRIGDDGHERGGTAGFMPPEQLDKGGQMDERTDVFALGVMLFMLLTGERPFADVDFERWRSTDEPFRADLLAFEAPSLTASERNIPESLDRLCIEALRLDKEQRLPTATDLARGLDRFLEGQKEKKRRRRHANELCDQANMIADSHIDLVRSRPERVYELARLRARTAP
ncbi:MAG: serine/threonine-protein kinase, partial [Myxococcota bacterium]